jgi:hypothetical protein
LLWSRRDRSIGGDFNCNVVCREHHRDRSYARAFGASIPLIRKEFP